MISVRKKMTKLIALTMLGATLVSSSALAANSAFAFNVSNTGQKFTTDSKSANTKGTNDVPFVVRADSMTFTESGNGYGMAFTPMKKTLVVYSQAAPQIWLASSGRKTGTWNSKQGKAGTTYYLAARIDDIATGRGSTSGAWNADAY